MSTVTNDYYLVRNKHFPGDRTGVLVGEDNYDHEITDYVNMTNNTKGDLTTTNVDRSYDKIIMGMILGIIITVKWIKRI